MSNHVSSSSGSNWNITKFIIALTGLITAAATLYVALNNGSHPPPPTSAPGVYGATRESSSPAPNDPPTPSPADSIPTVAQIARLQQETRDAFREGRLAEAEILLRETEGQIRTALQHLPEDTEYLVLEGFHHKNVATYHKLSGDDQTEGVHLAQAKRVFESVLVLDDQNANAWLGLGNIYLLRCEIDEAESAIDKALIINPEHPSALNDKALIPRHRVACE
jgi:tetratricopeptide (TPR) repeat protein